MGTRLSGSLTTPAQHSTFVASPGSNPDGSFAPRPISPGCRIAGFLFWGPMRRRIEIGFLFSRSGSYALISDACRTGALAAIAEVRRRIH